MAETSLSKDIRNIIGGACLGTSVGFLLVLFYVNYGWIKNAPSIPDLEKGLIFAKYVDGSLIYFSAIQSATNSLSAWVIPLILIDFLLPPKTNITRFLFFFRWEWDDPKKFHMITTFAFALVTIVLASFYGHKIIETLMSLGLKPSSETLSE